ncbi:MAG: hypothetical protein ACRDLB_14980 [Actinomycetota bacterium]
MDTTVASSHSSGLVGGDERGRHASLRTPTLWGVVVGVLYAAAPLGFWWLEAATVYAMGLAIIASVYVGLAVADGRSTVIAAEVLVATGFIIVATISVTGSPWLAVIGLAGHGLKDLWQHRRHFVANTRWWPPFCVVVDWVAAVIIAIALISGANFH